MAHRSLLVCLALLVASQAALAAVAPPVYDAKLIVADLKACPVKNVEFDKKDFDADQLVALVDVLAKGNVTQQCQDDAVSNLADCYSDGTLQVMTGCCTKACEGAIGKSIKSGCFASYVKAICADPTTAQLRTGLAHAAKRCNNYEAACTPEMMAAAKAVTAKGANATAAAAAKEPAAAAPAPAPAPAKSGALALAAVQQLPLAAAAAAVLLAALY